jgi:hypothetical protein
MRPTSEDSHVIGVEARRATCTCTWRQGRYSGSSASLLTHEREGYRYTIINPRIRQPPTYSELYASEEKAREIVESEVIPVLVGKEPILYFRWKEGSSQTLRNIYLHMDPTFAKGE